MIRRNEQFFAPNGYSFAVRLTAVLRTGSKTSKLCVTEISAVLMGNPINKPRGGWYYLLVFNPCRLINVQKNRVVNYPLCAAFSGSALAENISKDVEFNGLKFAETANGLTNITGTGANKTRHEINMVMIKFNLLQNGKIIGQSVDMGNHFEPGQSWKILASYNSIELKPDSFRVTEVSVH